MALCRWAVTQCRTYMLQGGQEHRDTMVTMQLLVLTVVLTLPSVEQLTLRNPEYVATVDKVRVMGS